jgi:membrane protein
MAHFAVQALQKKESFHKWLWREPATAENSLSLFLRACCRIGVVCYHEFWRDAVLLRAGALTFAVILAVVPVLALSTAVLKGLGAGDQMRLAAHQFIDTMAVEIVEEPPPSYLGEEPLPSTESQLLDETFYYHLKRSVDTIFDYVEHTDFATLGIIGMVGLFITVISLLATIEESMNAVWDTGASRPLGRKIMDYLALMLLLPLAVNLAMAAMAVFQSEEASSIIKQLFPVAWAGPLLVKILILCLLVATLTICYRFLPNSGVNFRPALIGGILGGIAWLLLQALYINLQVGVARYNAIYGSFATLPLFLLWVYSSWVVFLSGAEISYAAQGWRHYLPHRKSLAPSTRLAFAFDLLRAVYDDFRKRRPSDLLSLSQRLGYSEADTEIMVTDLLAAGYLRRVESNGLVPGTNADQVMVTELVDFLWGAALLPSTGGRLVAEALTGAKSALAGRTLQEVDEEEPATNDTH